MTDEDYKKENICNSSEKTTFRFFSSLIWYIDIFRKHSHYNIIIFKQIWSHKVD